MLFMGKAGGKVPPALSAIFLIRSSYVGIVLIIPSLLFRPSNTDRIFVSGNCKIIIKDGSR